MLELDSFYQKVVKNNNRKKIFRVIQEKKRVTKLDISRILNLSITTVSSNIKEMVNIGLISERGFEDSTGGRKAQVIEYLPDSRFSLGMELKETHARIILTNLDSAILKERCFDAIDTNILIDECRRITESFLSDFAQRDRIMGLGISLPGTVNMKTSVLETAPNMHVSNVSFKKLEEDLKMPVYIGNEANCSAYGEYEYNDTFQSPLFYVSVTEGIGSAIIIDRKLYNGKNHRAGEIGHISIDCNGDRLCSCGNTGCWELFASERALEKAFAEATGSKVSGVDDVFERINEPVVKDVIMRYSAYLAVGIRSLLMIFDPSFIVIGGNISKYGKELLPAVKKHVFDKNEFYTEKDVKIEFARLKENSGIIGAALFPIKNML
ncbi:MAG: ROK family transcriptional regulator [Spirochaetes bacterium]|nr:ROK family transcriptional regulator [Spirochaetota bacterium]